MVIIGNGTIRGAFTKISGTPPDGYLSFEMTYPFYITYLCYFHSQNRAHGCQLLWILSDFPVNL